jgi:hypothetical protein
MFGDGKMMPVFACRIQKRYARETTLDFKQAEVQLYGFHSSRSF